MREGSARPMLNLSITDFAFLTDFIIGFGIVGGKFSIEVRLMGESVSIV